MASSRSDDQEERDILARFTKQQGKIRAKIAAGDRDASLAARLAEVTASVAELERVLAAPGPGPLRVDLAVEWLTVSSIDPHACTARVDVRVHTRWTARRPTTTPSEDDFDPRVEILNGIELDEVGEPTYPEALQDDAAGVRHRVARCRGEVALREEDRGRG